MFRVFYQILLFINIFDYEGGDIRWWKRETERRVKKGSEQKYSVALQIHASNFVCLHLFIYM